MLRSYIDHCANGCVFCLQRGAIHRWQWQSWKAHEDVEEMVMATASVLMREYAQTMGREAAIVVFGEMIASLIVIATC